MWIKTLDMDGLVNTDKANCINFSGDRILLYNAIEDEPMIIAKYTEIKKTKKAFVMLKDAIKNKDHYFEMPKDSEL